MSTTPLEFDRRPSVPAYMLRALYPGVLRGRLPFPLLRARWRPLRPDAARLARFRDLTGLKAEGGLPVLYPQVITFPLQMVLLTHPSLPIPIWNVLQIRNSLLQHRTIPADAVLDAEAAVVGQRVWERGLELDLHVSVEIAGALAWEGLTTYLYRGRFGSSAPAGSGQATPPASGVEVARWCTERGGGFQFGSLSGDTNGIHYWGAYAKLFGLQGAIHHPHALIGQCLARLPESSSPAQRLDLWLKGPVYYGTDVALESRREERGVVFSLREAGRERPAVVGRRYEAEPGSRLLGG